MVEFGGEDAAVPPKNFSDLKEVFLAASYQQDA